MSAFDRERRAFQYRGVWWLEGEEERPPRAGEVYLAEGRPQEATSDHDEDESARILVRAHPDEVFAGIRMSHDQRDCVRAAAAQLEETAAQSEGAGYVDEDPSATLMVASELREIADLYDAAEAKLARRYTATAFLVGADDVGIGDADEIATDAPGPLGEQIGRYLAERGVRLSARGSADEPVRIEVQLEPSE